MTSGNQSRPTEGSTGRYSIECDQWVDLVRWTFHEHNPARAGTAKRNTKVSFVSTLLGRLVGYFFHR